jgi:regulator of protease activity HflC (stomatin/prohibitin superfamily)
MATINYDPNNPFGNMDFKKMFNGVTGLGRLIPLLVGVILLLIFVLPNTIVINDERQGAVVTRLGQYDRTILSGLHFAIPGLNTLSRYRLDTQVTTADASAATKDQQSVQIKASVFSRLDPTNLEGLFKKVRDQNVLNTTILPSVIQEAIKSVSAKYTAAELLEKRDLVKSDVEKALQERLKEYYVIVSSVNLENLDYSKAFDAAIEQKVIAEQDALRAREQLGKEKINTEISAERAKQTQIEGSALQGNPSILQKQFLEKWDGKLPTVSGQQGTILDINSLFNTK